MNRRDMIIITVLLNIALLSALIALAVSDVDSNPADTAAAAVSAAPARQSLPAPAAPASLASMPSAAPAIPAARTPLVPPPAAAASAAAEAHSIAFVPIGGEEELDNVLRGFHTNTPAVYMQGDVKKTATTTAAACASAAAAETAREPQEGFVEVTVKRGDVLERIARANHTTVAAIKQVNALKGERLIIGQVLRIPVGKDLEAAPQPIAAYAAAIPAAGAVTAPESPNKGSSDLDDAFYVVKNGDNPWKIARQFHVKFEDLLKLNGLDEERARNLKVGQRLRVR